MDEPRLLLLLKQYFDNTITRDDCEELLKYLDEGKPTMISAAIDEVLKAEKTPPTFSTQQKETVYRELAKKMQQRETDIPQPSLSPRRPIAPLRWIGIAASVMLILSVGLVRYFHPSGSENSAMSSKEITNDILLPDDNQAILTLADGRSIVLGDAKEGLLAQEFGVQIKKTADGSILYEASNTRKSTDAPAYNTFSTPKGHMYRLKLPDGTNVWLNTASSLRYPVAFTEKERKVALSGEAFFEVEKDADRPFIVEANGSTIRVLGTHFNLSAYSDEPRTTTTVVEGAVNVSKNGKSVALKPGQQAVVDDMTGTIRQSQVDVRWVIAWKNGYFRFDDESVADIINKISRWYAIDTVEYRGQINDRFTGTFQRSKQVSQLFSNLEKLAPITFEIKERRVIIMK